MNQPRSLARRLRWPLLSLGLLAVLAGLACWLLLPADPIGLRAFERIQLGMTEEEIEAVIGFPSGLYIPSNWTVGNLVAEKGLANHDMGAIRYARTIPIESWDGVSYWIDAAFDENGHAIGVYLYEVPRQKSYFQSLRDWLAL